MDSVPGQVIPKTQKIVPDVALLNILYHKVWNGVVAFKKGTFRSPSTKVANFNYFLYIWK